MCVKACVKDLCVHVEAKGQPQVVFLRSHPYCFLRQGVFMGLGLISSARMASEPQGPCCPCLPNTSMCHNTWPFTWAFVIMWQTVWFDEFDPYP